MLDSGDDPLKAILAAYEPPEPEAPKPFPREFTSAWLFDEINDVYHKPLGRSLSEQPHDELCGIIEQAIGDCTFSSGGQKLVMIGVPRGSLKTTITAENVPCVVLTRNNNARVLTTAFRYDVAQKRLAAARWHFEQNG